MKEIINDKLISAVGLMIFVEELKDKAWEECDPYVWVTFASIFVGMRITMEEILFDSVLPETMTMAVFLHQKGEVKLSGGCNCSNKKDLEKEVGERIKQTVEEIKKQEKEVMDLTKIIETLIRTRGKNIGVS